MKKIFLAIPTYGGMEPLFVQSLLSAVQQLARRPEKPFDLQVVMKLNDSLVSRARNRLAAAFMKSDCHYLLFLDTDLIFGLDQIEALAAHDSACPDSSACAIVCGLYPKKQPQLEWVCNMLPDEEADEHGLHRVKYAGTGCMLIARRVFEHMIDAHPEIAYGPDHGEAEIAPGVAGYDFFAVGPRLDPAAGYVRYLSEDYYFCQRAIELGYDIQVDTRVVLKHIGQIVYPLADPFDRPSPA